MPGRDARPDEFAIFRLASGWLHVDVETGAIYRKDGVTRAETARPTGYGAVYLGRFHGKVRIAQAHRIVFIAHYGPIPGMYEVNHRNGHRWDNRLANLDLVTHANNCLHARLQPYVFVIGEDINGPEDRPESHLYATSSDRTMLTKSKRRS